MDNEEVFCGWCNHSNRDHQKACPEMVPNGPERDAAIKSWQDGCFDEQNKHADRWRPNDAAYKLGWAMSLLRKVDAGDDRSGEDLDEVDDDWGSDFDDDPFAELNFHNEYLEPLDVAKQHDAEEAKKKK